MFGDRRATVLLAAGAMAGIGVAAVGLVKRPGRGLPADAVARVNGQVISRAEYGRVVTGLASDRRDGVDAADRGRVLDRLIEEELLVERGLSLGLARRDARVRKDIVAAVIDAVAAGSADRAPSDAELETFYRARRDFFARPDRLRVRQVWCRAATPDDGPGAEARAREAVDRLRRGEDFAVVRGALGDPELAPLPDALLPPAKLLDYLGPTAVRSALALDVGAVSGPVRSGTGYHVLQVLERDPETPAPFADVRDDVLAEFRREAGERALRAYVADLRAHAEIDVASSPP